MATVNAERFSVDGQSYAIIDGTARENAQLALNNAEYNRQSYDALRQSMFIM